MKCNDVNQMMHRYLENTLDTAVNTRVHQHIEGCVTCQAALHEIQSVSSMFTDQAELQIPETALLNIQNGINLYRLKKNTTKSGLLSSLKDLSLKGKLAISFLTILAVMSGILMSYDLGFTSGKMFADVPQEPAESIYKLDAFNSSSDRSLYSMYTSMVMENSEDKSR